MKDKEDEKNYRTLLDNIPVGIFRSKSDGTLISINSSLVKLLGYKSKEELFNIATFELCADIHSREELINILKKQGSVNDFQTQIHQKNGSKRWVSLNVKNVPCEGEKGFYLDGIVMDITERRQAEEKLNESETKYRTLFEKSDDAILIIEGDKFVDCNPATVKMLGYTSKNDLLVTHPSQLSPPTQADGKNSFEKANEMISIAFDKGSHRFEWDHKRKNGEVFPVEVLLTAVPKGERQFLHVVWRDITERKKMEKKLLQAQKLESVGVLAGGIAHDFNNLLTAILNNLYLIKSRINPEEQVYARANAAERAAVRAQGLTQQLLTFSKGGAPIKSLIDIRELISESFSIALRGSNVRCENLIPDDIWHIEVDAGQINQAINNIIINADQSMSEGGTIKVSSENVVVGAENNLTLKEGNYIKISIKDACAGSLIHILVRKKKGVV
jgi:PAS domain S-box-containing protein